MTKGEKIVIALGLIIVGLLVVAIFKGGKINNTGFEEAIKAKDELREYVKNELKDKRTELNEVNEKLEVKDSLLSISYIQHQNIYKQLNAQLKKIPKSIADIANDDAAIRRAFATE